MADESRYVWGPLKRAIDKRGWWAQRLEDSTTPGIPDVNLFMPKQQDYGQQDWWLELKHVVVNNLTIDSQVALGLRKEQYLWLIKAWQYFRNVALVVRVNDSWYVWTEPTAWAYAKGKFPWARLIILAGKFKNPDQVLDYLRSGLKPL